jgi:hypothetical protein
MIWDIGATLDLIQKRHGRAQRDAANHCFQSVNERLRYAKFHYTTLKNDFDAFKELKIGTRMVIEVAWSEDDAERGEYVEFMDRVGAHALAGLQSIHAVADLLASSTYVSLNLNSHGRPLKERDITLKSTLDRLSQNPRCATAARLLKSLKAHRCFAHVDALCNMAKHSGIVRTSLNEDFTGMRTERIQIYFKGFMRSEVSYPATPITDVLAPAFAHASAVTVNLGNELKRVLT